MAINCVDSHHIGSGLSQCVAGNFTSATDRNLLVAKSTRIELYLVTGRSVRPLKEILLYGRVALIKAFRAVNESKDFLFVMSTKYNVAVLEFVQNGNTTDVVTRAHGNVADPNCRPVETRPLCAVDPNGSVIGLRLFDGFFKVIPLEKDNKELMAFNVRMKEQHIWDLQFLYDCHQPTLALIYEESNCRQFKTYELSLNDKELVRVSWSPDNIESESSILIPVSKPYGGVIVIGQQSIVYLSDENKCCAIASSPIRQSTITSYSRVDGSRYILGDMSGRLFILELKCDEDVVRDLKLELLGEIPIPECLTYLDSGVIYVGSRIGDPQLIKLNLEPNQNGSYLEVLETLSNSETFDDMITVDIDRHRQGSLTNSSGPLREVDRQLRHNPYLSLQSIHNPKPLTDNRQRKSQSVRSRSQSVDCQSMGGIFDIDLDIDEGNAFDSISYSDEEDDGSDDSIAFRNTTNEYNSLNKGRTIPTPQHNAQQNQSMAYSLPIQVPKWKAFHRHNNNIEDEEVAMIPNGEEIGESIKKLAKSVRNDSEIFGDRPRRRTNTFVDLIKSRPQ